MNDTNTTERLVGSVEASRRTGIGRDTLRRYAERGILRAQRTPTGAYKFRIEDLDGLLRPVGTDA